jgi:glucose/arabinose dehydrogenase
MRKRWFVLAGLLVAGVTVGLLRKDRLLDWLVTQTTPEYAPPAYASPKSARVRLDKVAEGFTQPTDLQWVLGRRDVLVVLEKGGQARLAELSRGVAKPTSLLFHVEVTAPSELGLLGLAFHPKFPENGRFFVNYNPASGERRTVVSEWVIAPGDVGKREATEKKVVLEIPQPYPNHNAGQLAFGPDGYLYVGVGDGGWKDDPHGHGQNLATLLGTILRIDVDAPPGKAYGVPADNPFLARKGARPEIWAYGLRNPWRYSFDPHGRLVAADVGQDRYEEIDLVAKGDNLGWNVREGFHCFSPANECPTAGLVDPIFEYDRGSGTSITGGYVVTSSETPTLEGKYVFGDFTSGNVWALSLPSPHLPARGPAPTTLLGTFPYLISTFGRDPEGRVYLADYARGGVYRIAQR